MRKPRQSGTTIRIPALGILFADTLSLHNPEQLTGTDEPGTPRSGDGLLLADPIRRQRYDALKDPSASDAWVDVACGNPPYVGEKQAAVVLRRTRERYPYWNNFVGPHLDYLYWFLVLGVSKLREGGRFGFITTEYWLRADGAAPLRGYLARTCRIERIILFRSLRLFPDAPGQHSMVIVGERTTPPDPLLAPDDRRARPFRPRVSVYEGATPTAATRREILTLMREGRSRLGVRSFQASASPNDLGRASWAEVVLTRDQVARRRRLQAGSVPLDLDVEEGMISGADRLTSAGRELLPVAVVRRLEAAGGNQRPGIFTLNPDEIRALGSLNRKERQLPRRTVNTTNVYPYTAVLPDDADQLLYLPAPPREPHSTTEELQRLSFPSGMPHIEQHLRQFEPVLMAKVRAYNERRPWWSLHRPRPRIQPYEQGIDGWSNYGLTTRWGGGGKLIVGLAPTQSVPASGLQALLPKQPATAAYVVGLMNSSAVQDLADSLPPGQIRQSDLRGLGLPYLTEAAEDIAERAIALAAVVSELVTLSSRWPKLGDALRADIDLALLPLDAWAPAVGLATSWGTLQSVRWVDVGVSGPQSGRIAAVSVDRDLFGLTVTARDSRAAQVRLHLPSDDDNGAEALCAMLLGLQAQRATLRRIPSAAAPTAEPVLIEQLSSDLDHVNRVAEQYRTLRAEIDDLVDTLL
jgi:hypothetical protein